MPRRAFTLVELLVVISIIGPLSSIAVVSMSSARVKTRNQQRKTNLLQISKALELYYSQNGDYPSTGGSANWRGNCAGYGSYPDSGAGAWIPNMQSFMAQLPHDPNTSKPTDYCTSTPTYACYLYTSNGTDYKALAYCTPEGATPTSDPFVDPARGAGAFAVYSPGARNW